MPGQNYSEIHTKGKNFERKKRISVPGVVKKTSGYRLRGINKPITYTSVREDVLSVLKKLGLSSEDYGLHSMRTGGYTIATHLGVKERFIKKHRRWKSDRVKDGYTQPTLNDVLLVAQNLGL